MSDDLILSALARLESGQTAMQADITGLTGRMDRLETGQTSIQADMTSLRIDLMARMDRFNDSLQAIRDDIQVNFARADKAIDKADGLSDVVRAQGREISGMQRQILRMRTDIEELKNANGSKGA